MASGLFGHQNARGLRKELPPGSSEEFPYLVEHAEQHMAKRKTNAIREFEFGLDLILDGLEKILAATSRRPASVRRSSRRAH
ncbi:MAG: TetR/AcrR family transcriptional regulator C-terminal domain-containing protein [Candidatus Limnocylindria bacterium]